MAEPHDDEHSPPPRPGVGGAADDALRALADIQQMGFRAAAEVVDRMAPLIEGMGQFGSSMARGATTAGPEAPDPRGNDRFAYRNLRADIERAIDANLDLMRSVFDAYADILDGVIQNGATPSNNSRLDGKVLELGPVLPGRKATSTIWIHNTTGDDAEKLRVHCSDLVNHLGEVIDKDSAKFDPPLIETSRAGESIPVAITLKVGKKAQPGIYRGQLFVTNLPDETMSIIAEVVEPVPSK